MQFHHLILFFVAVTFLNSCSSFEVDDGKKKHPSNLEYLTKEEKLSEPSDGMNLASGNTAPRDISATAPAAAQPPMLSWTYKSRVESLGYGDDEAKDVYVNKDGKMFVVGPSLTASNFFDFALLCYDRDGSVEKSFGKMGRVTTDFGGGEDHALAIVAQPDGKLIVGGYTRANDKDFALARYFPDGTLDNSFGRRGRVITDFSGKEFPKPKDELLQPETKRTINSDDVIHSIVVRPNGKIVVAGYATGGYMSTVALAQYHPDGKLDRSFGDRGVKLTRTGLFDEEARTLVLLPDGKLIVGGYSEYSTPGKSFFLLVRYKKNGEVDTGFGENGNVVTGVGQVENVVESAVLQKDGKLLVAGYSTGGAASQDSVVARYNPSGKIDTDFGEDGTVKKAFGPEADGAKRVRIQKDGKILVAGTVATLKGRQQVRLARLESDGDKDENFGIGGVISTKHLTGSRQDKAHGMSLLPDGSIVVVGYTKKEGYGTDFATILYSAR